MKITATTTDAELANFTLNWNSEDIIAACSEREALRVEKLKEKFQRFLNGEIDAKEIFRKKK